MKTKQNYYFTFGSSKQFPFQNGYIIVEANDIKQAIALFRAYYPDRNEQIVNCSDFYSEDEWNEHVKTYYASRKPKAIISSELKTLE